MRNVPTRCSNPISINSPKQLHTHYRDERPRNVYWAMGLVRGHLTIRGQVDVSEEVQISELWKDSGHEGLGR